MKKLLALFLLLCLPLHASALKEDTAISVTVWIFNTSDGTAKTGLNVTTITVRYIKSDGTTASFSPTASGGSNDMVEKGQGAYFLELTAAQLDTAGIFELGCTVSGGVCAPTSFQIDPASSYDMVHGGNVASISDTWNVATADVTAGIGLQIKTNLDQRVSTAGGQITTGTATAGGTNTITLAAAAPSISLVNKRILLTGGTGTFQSGIITAYDTGTKVATVQDSSTGGNWTTVPGSGTVYVIHDASIGALVDDILTAAKIAASAIGASEIAASAITSSEAPNLDATVSSRASQTSVDTIDDFVDTEVSAIKTKTDFLPSATAGAAGGLFIAGTNAATTVTTAFTTTFTGNLTGSVASVTGAVASVTGAVGSVTGNVGGNVSGNLTGTIGGLTAAALKDFFDTDTTTTYASAVIGSVVKETADNAGGSALTTGAIADAVWDEATSGHTTAGTTGKALTDAASAGDPWSTSLPGAYGAGTAGYIIGNTLDAAMTTRAAASSLTTAQSDLDDIQTRIPSALISGRMDSSVGAMASGVLSSTAIASDAFTAAKFAADASTEFAATLMATTFEGSHTFKHFLQYGAAALFGKYNSGSGQFNFRDLADTKNRLIYTTTSTARTAVTYNPD